MTSGFPRGGSRTPPLAGKAFVWSSHGEAMEIVMSLHDAADREGPRAVAALNELDRVLSSPIRIVVRGREAVGKTKVIQALSARLGDEAAFVESNLQDAVPHSEIVVHTLTSAPRAEDKESSAGVDTSMAYGALNKCDTFPSVGADGPWGQAREAAERSARELGFPVAPVIAILETAVVDDESFGCLQAIADSGVATPPSVELFLQASAGSPVSAGQRERLVRDFGLYGLHIALGAIRDEGGRSPAALTESLRRASGFDPLVAGLQELIVIAWARRISEFLVKLGQTADLGVMRDEVEAALASRTAVWLRMDAALGSGILDPVDLVIDFDDGPDPQKALQHALRYRQLGAKSADPRAAGLAWDLHVGFLRLWAELSGVDAAPSHGSGALQ